MAKFNKAPLPFVGQKRNFLKAFNQVLAQITDDGDGWTIVDVFGGSGLLAHTAKQQLPKACVVYNDFDGYADRLQHIDDTNRLRRILAGILPPKNNRKLSDDERTAVLDAILTFDGYIDTQCVASWLLFSGKQIKTIDELIRHQFYNTLPATDYPQAAGYLDGLVITQESFEQLIPRYADNPKTLLVLDPPYLSTKQQAYANPRYFGMVAFLRLMRQVRPPFVLFSSTRSELPAYLDFVKQYEPDTWARFRDFQQITYRQVLNHNSSYEDNMIYRI